MSFSIITATLQRDSLIECCKSVDEQSLINWQHIVVVDGGPIRADLLSAIAHPQRIIVCLGVRYADYGNTPRHLGWKLATGGHCIFLDDDNRFADNTVLRQIDAALGASDIAVAFFPIMRHGRHFYLDPPGCCRSDTANLVVRRDIGQWPAGPEYVMDGLFIDRLVRDYGYTGFPDAAPIIVMEASNEGR
jgi:glycosyltransferase involved in cell wall biosynthesis